MIEDIKQGYDRVMGCWTVEARILGKLWECYFPTEHARNVYLEALKKKIK